jgi:hypothetical protein
MCAEADGHVDEPLDARGLVEYALRPCWAGCKECPMRVIEHIPRSCHWQCQQSHAVSMRCPTGGTEGLWQRTRLHALCTLAPV